MTPCYNSLMRRLQIQLEEPLYEALRLRAFEGRVSMASVARTAIEEALATAKPRRYRLEDFEFIGAGRHEGDGKSDVSVEHDRAIADAIQARFG